jgi:hypothetical protein
VEAVPPPDRRPRELGRVAGERPLLGGTAMKKSRGFR